MTSFVTFILLVGFSTSVVYGRMDCSFGTSNNAFDKFVNSCPPIIGDQSKEYCCLNTNAEFYCCDAQEFALRTGLGIIIPAIIAVIVVVTFFVLCISCLCCSCCPWYKRRHRGTVYGRVQPGVVVVHPGSNPMPNQTIHTIYPPYPASNPQVSASAYQGQPPPYTAEPYAKQAPYNPNYQHQ
ncbi:protein shisa-5-like [Microplitis mediator]|uniref:protein shisa-5-like n=1 Tax=Microplitis mediator TaxID=375433 RepID=UPI002555295F|nr:protein shisa-5-like [Microplitis mediator]